jgi:heat shock protein HslJ
MEPAAPTTIATLVFEATTASGSDGCNRYRFDYSVDAASLAFADLSITGASCDADRAGQGELVIDALADTRHFARREGHLELTSAHGAVLAEFRPAEPLLLEGVSWRLTGLDGDEGGLITPVGGVSLAFDAVGRLVGVSGCNDYSADYTARGSELVLTGIAATERSCANPPGVMAFEAGYLASLPRVASFSTSLTELTLRDSDGETVAEYRFGGRTR